MGRNLRRVLILIAVPMLFASCGIMPVEEELPAAPVIRSYGATEYDQTTVMRGDMILTKTIKCTYASARQERYSFPLGGMYIDKVYVSEGQQVTEGTLLAELEQGDLAQRISEGEYAVKVLQTNRSNLPETQNLEMERQDAILEGMQQQINHLMTEAEVASQEEEEGALIDQANATLIQMLELEKQKESLAEVYERQVQEADDALYIAQLRLKELKEELRERQIYAGINGTIIYVQVIKEGDRSVKDKNIITIADLDTVVFTVKGEDTQYFPVGTQVTVLCDKKEFPAQAVDPSEFGLVPEQGEDAAAMAYLQLLQPDPTLENGMSGSIRVVLDQREDVLYVHKDAVKTAGGGHFVYMLDENGYKVRHEVTTGLESGDYVEIVSGLTEGDSVILD